MQHTIAIVDDHLLIAKALTGVIDNFPSYKVLYEAEHGKALMEKFKVAKNIPDIVLLDIAMPVMDGFETAAWISANHPGVLVLALSMQGDETSLIKMIRAGARGYLLKNIHPEDLKKALDELVAKGYSFPEWAAGKFFSNIGVEHKNKEAQAQFSERESEFLKYCCSEMTYKEMAAKMFCSARTVEGYRDALFEKLGLRTRVGLAVYALGSGFVQYGEI